VLVGVANLRVLVKLSAKIGDFMQKLCAYFLLSLGIMALAGCTKKEGVRPVEKLSAFEAYGSVQNDFAILVDVREEPELKKGLAQPALWFPTSKIEADGEEWKQFVKGLPKKKQIIFYCAGGSRAQDAAEKLAAEGYRTGNMGGFSDWQALGLPVRQP
jgi:rhodanese-related sulfurtransferase